MASVFCCCYCTAGVRVAERRGCASQQIGRVRSLLPSMHARERELEWGLGCNNSRTFCCSIPMRWTRAPSGFARRWNGSGLRHGCWHGILRESEAWIPGWVVGVAWFAQDSRRVMMMMVNRRMGSALFGRTSSGRGSAALTPIVMVYGDSGASEALALAPAMPTRCASRSRR